MNRKTGILVVATLLSMLAGGSLYQLTSAWSQSDERSLAEEKRPSQQAPISVAAIPLIDLEGTSRELGSWKQPVLVVNFWAPWCQPCRKEVPDLIALQNEFGEQVQVLGLAYDSVENIESFIVEYAMNYPSFVANQYIPMYNTVFKNTGGGLPFTAVVDQERKVSWTHVGIINPEALREQVSRLFASEPVDDKAEFDLLPTSAKM